MSESENARTVEAIYAAFGRGDLASILNSLAEQVEWQHPGPDIPWGGARHGRAAVAQFFAALVEHVDMEQFVPEQFVARGDDVIVLGRERARVKSSGRVYETEWVHVWSLEGGSVIRFREYTDTAAILGALAARKMAGQPAE